MAGEKTEQPTDKKLREAREKGDVPKSQDTVTAVSVLSLAAYFILNAKSVLGEFTECLDFALTHALSMPYAEALREISEKLVSFGLAVSVPCIAFAFCGALISLVAQTGALFAPKAAVPRLDNLSPSKWFKKVFSAQSLFNLLRDLAKILILCVIVYSISSDAVRDVMRLGGSDMRGVWAVTGELMRKLLLHCCGAFCAIAAIDFVFTRFRYVKRHMMSKEEVKQEYKNSEGDPLIKSRRRQLHRELLQSGRGDAVRRSAAVIANPTHYAVAVHYEKGVTPLPLVSAKGRDDTALQIRKIAEEAGVPVVEDPALARSLYAEGVEGEKVPSDLLLPVARILSALEAASKGGI